MHTGTLASATVAPTLTSSNLAFQLLRNNLETVKAMAENDKRFLGLLFLQHELK